MNTRIFKSGWIMLAAACLTTEIRANDIVDPRSVFPEKNETKEAANPKLKKYDEIITKEATTSHGLMDIHKVNDKYYLEVPMSLMGKPMLMSTKVSAISNNKDVIAGQMPQDPLFLEWSCDEERLYLLNAERTAICESGKEMLKGFERNYLKPVYQAFPIKTRNITRNTAVIDVSKFFCSDERHLSPFIPTSPLDGLMKTTRMKGTFKADMSSILSFKAFPENIIFRTRMVYSVNKEPFTAEVTTCMMRLADQPMRPRLEDERIGYFTTKYIRFSDRRNAAEKVSYINRWRLEPKPEDLERYKKGELVEPAKPIVYYLDDAFPEPWRKYLKQGIEDWQQAFEEIGFKNAIIAKDFPTDDPDFDPDDIRYSCVRYSSIRTANAMGPSWVDPRSGEIIQGSVYFYHDVLKLVHDWRFIQTAVVDPEARAHNFDDMNVLGPLLRYLVAHEVGHTIGLLHNMRASYSYPVDSLRSPSFTAKYGTTPSIMDYARYNYVAQPGDNVQWLLPPVLGVYDKYAIAWGYRPIYEAETPEEERPVLNRWIQEKADDPMYWFGEQEFFNMIDPASQTESLGDDCIKASTYGLKNLKILMSHLKEWTVEEGKGYEYTKHMYLEAMKQFNRYIGHAAKYIGGNFLQYPVYGDGKPGFIPVPREKQKEALQFIFDQVRQMPEWMLNPEIIHCFRPANDIVHDMQMTYIKNWIGYSSRVGYTAKLAQNEVYTEEEYMDDLFRLVFGKTMRGEKLENSDMNMEYAFVYAIFKNLDMLQSGSQKGFADSGWLMESDYPCCYMGMDAEKQARSLAATKKESDLKVSGKTVSFGILQEIRNLLKKKVNKGDDLQKNHYRFLLHEIEKAL